MNFCANASKIATVTIHSPLLPNPLKGFVYLAAQEANPFGQRGRDVPRRRRPGLGDARQAPGEGELCQGAGEVIAGMTCQALGQIVSTFENSRSCAFEDAELHFFGGERAPLASPTRCGTYTTEASFTPWSGGEAGPRVLDVRHHLRSERRSVPGRGASAAVQPVVDRWRDERQRGRVLAVHADDDPPARRTEPAVRRSASAPGPVGDPLEHRTVPRTAGQRGHMRPEQPDRRNDGLRWRRRRAVHGQRRQVLPHRPLQRHRRLHGGRTGCAPFGITFEVPAKAGPFDFAKTQRNHPACDCVLVSGKIEINPYTAAITVTSNPPGTPDAIPTSIEGIPLEIQHVNAITTRGELPVQPDELQQDGSHRDDPLQRRRHGHDRGAVPGHELRGVEVRAEIRGLDDRENEQSERREPHCEGDRARTHRSAPRRTSRRSKSNSPSSCPRG